MAFPTTFTNAQDTITEIVAAHINNLETKVGVDGSLDTNSLDYKVAQAVKNGDSPTFGDITDSGLTASLPVFTDGSKKLVSKSVADTRTALGVGTGDTPTFAGETLSGLTASLPVFTGASKELVSKSVVDTRAALGVLNSPNLITNSGFGVWSNSTLENVGSNLITGWTNVNWNTFTSAGANISSAINTGTWGEMAYCNAFTGQTQGKLYKVVITVTINSGAAPLYMIENCDTGDIQGTLSPGVNTIIFEKNMANASNIQVLSNAASNCSFVCTAYEVTPGCVAANALGPDGWTKSEVYTDLWREHNGTNTKNGSFYALKVTGGAVDGMVEQYKMGVPTWYTKIEHYSKYAGRTLTFGCWILTSTASKSRLFFRTSAGWTVSSYHTGGGAYEWIEVTLSVPSNITWIYWGLDAGISNTAYFSQPMLVFGSYIGAGNYQPIVGEIINIEGIFYPALPSASAIVNLEAYSSGKIPKGITGLFVTLEAKSSDFGVSYWLRSSSSGPYCVGIKSIVASAVVVNSGYVLCDSNGDIYVQVGTNYSDMYMYTSAIKL